MLRVSHRKYQTPRVSEQKIPRPKQDYRHFFIKDLGHDQPTILPTNGPKSTAPQPITHMRNAC